MKKNIGVLAVQGAFAEHINTLKKLDINTIEIRKKSDLTENHIDGIILPGGESTVMGKLINELGMLNSLKKFIQDGLPVFGTCAGLILLAKKITNDDNVYIGTMDIEVKRNAYGRQLGSFHTNGQFAKLGQVPMTFIRAPYIENVSKNVDILAQIDNHIVAAKQNNMIVTSFHPELTSDLNIHKYFLDLI
ncbi:pyridoxal 5'-phosphate synthase glutaminase subunit PdxT [Anaerovorax odorimutans]|uniref:pyridoxal 5'-phosphate synthase glutaminase subunit PdxT n=1 Tax=Anaerovorax odorimutans TaxID=109327 RepID=UPI00041C1C6F|nr:pyridoxal 5'-phosphate synthase glutaminase subunit PdxT [Anaerovorax odorimutans]